MTIRPLSSRETFVAPRNMDLRREPRAAYPEAHADSAAARILRCAPLLPYLALLQVGFAMPTLLPGTRCALTAPFHPCRRRCQRLGGLFSVALSVGSRPPGVTW